MHEIADRYGLVGSTVADKYIVERVAGEGGFGVVYRARHLIWDHPVALKCFTALSNAPEAYREQLLDLFVQEGKLLSALSSRSAAIVQAHDVGTLSTPGGTWLPWLVLEWLDGVSLDRLLTAPDGRPAGEPRSATEVFRLLDVAARALALAHARGVAHRDIKPANFFVVGGRLRPGATIKVLDFGIAKVMQSEAKTAMQATGVQVQSFTPNHAAPEQFDRSHGATGPWTDVYGMALVFLEVMRGGTPAFVGETFLQFAFASQNPDRRPTPRALGLDVSDAVEEVFNRALAVRVVDRFTNLGEFWSALAESLAIENFSPIPAVDDEPVDGHDLQTTGHRPAPPQATSATTVTPPASLALQTDATIVAPGTIRQTLPIAGPPVPMPDAPLPDTRGRAPLAAALVVLAVCVGLAALGALSGNSTPVVARGETRGSGVPAEAAAPPPASPCPDDMALVPAGKFFMGTDEDRPALALARPAHHVEVEAVCIDLTEVTLRAYRECSDRGECKRAFRDSEWPRGKLPKAGWEKLKAAHSPLCNESYADRGEHPVNCVTWVQADAYCRFRGKRLPTEAEWEHAARGSDGRTFPWGDERPSAAHLNACGPECAAWRIRAGLPPSATLYDQDDGHAATAPVGSFIRGKTQAGLLDMAGNVFEWTADPFMAYPYPHNAGIVPAAPMPDHNRVIRGGAFNSVEVEHTNPALRFPLDADAHSHGVGFRCAKEPVGG